MIYVLETRSGLFKIGRAKNVAKRFAQLKTGCPEPVEVILEWDIEDNDIEMERRLHRALAPWRCVGEWFRCSFPVLRQAFTAQRVQLGYEVSRRQRNDA